MSPDTLQALGWLWCLLGFAWHVRTAPPLVIRRTVNLPTQPLTVTLAREGGDGIRATGTLELAEGVEAQVVADELDRLSRKVRSQCGCDNDDGYQCAEHCTACYSAAFAGMPCGWHV